MIALLDSINQNANPLDYLNINIRKVEYYRQLAEQTTGKEAVQAQFNCADQMLKSGQNEAAIMLLLRLIQAADDRLDDNSKILYELLALGYMRLGEQENCISTHTPESCVLPIQGQGIYKMKSGPENAIKIYERILAQYPDDVLSRWLLNLANMAIGTWPAGVPNQYLFPVDIFQTKGDIRFQDVAIPLGLDVEGISGGVCMEDFDNDGNLDLFLTSYGLGDQVRFYRNNGDGTFTNVAHQIGLDNWLGFPKAVVWGDINNDQRPDLYISNLVGDNLLLLNRDGIIPEKWGFQDISASAGTQGPETSFPAFFFDYNNDGFDDIFTSNYPLDYLNASINPLLKEYLGHQPEGDWVKLYKNNGNGTFTDTHQEMGLNTVTFAMGHNFGDLDNDGWLDIFLGTGNPDLRALIPNRVFHNLEGKSCNRDAIGAKIHVTVLQPDGAPRHIYVTVGTGGSFGSSSLRQEIGLGNATKIVSVEVIWPRPGIPKSTYTNLTWMLLFDVKKGSPGPSQNL